MTDINIEKISLPVICTRGVVVFPQQDVVIEVARQKSLNAMDEANRSFDDLVFITCQKNIMNEDPRTNDVYDVGSICRIKTIRQKNGYKRVTFTGVERARIEQINDDGTMFFATVETLHSIPGDPVEEMALIRRVAKEIESMARENNRVPRELITQLAKGVNANQLADQYAQYFPLPIERKQLFIDCIPPAKRVLGELVAEPFGRYPYLTETLRKVAESD